MGKLLIKKILQENPSRKSNKKILHYHKWTDKRLAEIQKWVSLAISAILQMSNGALQYQQQPSEPKTFVILRIDAMTVLGKTSQLISAEMKDKWKPALNEDMKFVWQWSYNIRLFIWEKYIRKLKIGQGKL